MEREELRILLEKVESGQQTAEDALSDISLQPDMLVGNYADIDLAPTYAAGDAGGHLRGREDSRADRGDCVGYEAEGIAKYSDHPFIRREGGRDCQSTGILLLFDAADRYRQ